MGSWPPNGSITDINLNSRMERGTTLRILPPTIGWPEGWTLCAEVPVIGRIRRE